MSQTNSCKNVYAALQELAIHVLAYFNVFAITFASNKPLNVFLWTNAYSTLNTEESSRFIPVLFVLINISQDFSF